MAHADDDRARTARLAARPQMDEHRLHRVPADAVPDWPAAMLARALAARPGEVPLFMAFDNDRPLMTITTGPTLDAAPAARRSSCSTGRRARRSAGGSGRGDGLSPPAPHRHVPRRSGHAVADSAASIIMACSFKGRAARRAAADAALMYFSISARYLRLCCTARATMLVRAAGRYGKPVERRRVRHGRLLAWPPRAHRKAAD